MISKKWRYSWVALYACIGILLLAFLMWSKESREDFLVLKTGDEIRAEKIVFAASGDFGANPNTKNVLSSIEEMKADFAIALGDFKYDDLETEKQWCSFIKGNLKAGFPFELIAGNHESNGRDGHIDEFAKCLPDQIGGIRGEYAKEYFFDYPKTNPLARFILISPAIEFDEGIRHYANGFRNRWLKDAINEAKERNIPWLIVAMHKNCISSADKSCEVGEELINFLIDSKVDLILQGHDHTYQRSKQLTCVKAESFNPECVVRNDKENMFKKGEGGVIAIVGTGGAPLYYIQRDDLEGPYFDKLAGQKEDAHGFLSVKITEDTLFSEFVSVGKKTINDNFEISNIESRIPNIEF